MYWFDLRKTLNDTRRCRHAMGSHECQTRPSARKWRSKVCVLWLHLFPFLTHTDTFVHTFVIRARAPVLAGNCRSCAYPGHVRHKGLFPTSIETVHGNETPITYIYTLWPPVQGKTKLRTAHNEYAYWRKTDAGLASRSPAEEHTHTHFTLPIMQQVLFHSNCVVVSAVRTLGEWRSGRRWDEPRSIRWEGVDVNIMHEAAQKRGGRVQEYGFPSNQFTTTTALSVHSENLTRCYATNSHERTVRTNVTVHKEHGDMTLSVVMQSVRGGAHCPLCCICCWLKHLTRECAIEHEYRENCTHSTTSWQHHKWRLHLRIARE